MSVPQPNGPFTWVQAPWGRALTCGRVPVRHVFTTRNLQLRDDPREWKDVASFLGVATERLLLVRQVHGTRAAVARRGQASPWIRPEADIIVSDDPDVAIGVRVADCAPILLFDPRRRIAGAVHAGWRGTAAWVARTAIETMTAEFGTAAADVLAAIGPCLSACCGEVGPEVRDAFRVGGARETALDEWFTPGRGDRLLLDLPRANRDQLVLAGVPPDQIFDSGLCTRTHEDLLHSYRAHGAAAGRLLAAIRLAP